MNKIDNIRLPNESFPKTIDILNSSPVYDAKTKGDKIDLIKIEDDHFIKPFN